MLVIAGVKEGITSAAAADDDDEEDATSSRSDGEAAATSSRNDEEEDDDVVDVDDNANTVCLSDGVESFSGWTQTGIA